MTAVSCTGGHFIVERPYRAKVEAALEKRLGEYGGALGKFYHPEAAGNAAEKEALEFLYAYMPLADVTDYSTGFYLDNVRASFRAREEMPWGKSVPDRLFRHFVLPVRTNNESLDSCRTVFYRELKPRVQNLSMEDAVLEVNHWCHEHVVYAPSDARTSSPLNSVKNATGRCGEESTFTVAALRSVGIPARQVYTPRWAHTDDNHAWVEAWVDGKWHFFGACEPEPVLDLGWFNSSVSRAMLTHTKVFGDYDGPEEVVLRSPNYTEVNLIDNYVKTSSVTVEVKGEDGSPVDSARVYFMIYNYSEFYPALMKYTDGDGLVRLSAGRGDMLAWAEGDGVWGFGKISFGKDSSVTISISRNFPAQSAEMDIVPPPEDYVLPEVTPAQRAENDRRMALEDSIRTEYAATFPKAPSDPILVKSMGNHRTVSRFLSAYGDSRGKELLMSLSDKDLRDVTMECLLDSYNASDAILCPRVENEFLSPYKKALKDSLGPLLSGRSSSEILKWTKDNISIYADTKAWDIPMSAMGVLRSGLATPRSRNIFFVALCRSLGIEARKDPVTGKVQCRDDAASEWQDVDFGSGEKKERHQGRLVLNYTPVAGISNPGYYTHFSISKIENGIPHLMAFDEGQVDMGGGISWANSFKEGMDMDAGSYIMTSGLRLSDGSVPVTCRFFEVREGETRSVDLSLRVPQDALTVRGSFDADAILALSGRGFLALGVLGMGQEPTNHALRDISAARERLEGWGRPIVLLVETDGELNRLEDEIRRGVYGTMPSNVVIGTDPGHRVISSIKSNAGSPGEGLPAFLVGDSFGKVYFISRGYSIGIGEQIAGVAAKL